MTTERGIIDIGELNYTISDRESDLTKLSPIQQFELIRSKAAVETGIIPEPSRNTALLSLLETSAELREQENPDWRLNIKFGIDPTGKDVHLGHIVPLLMAKRFLRMGHNISFVIGDFTAQIGDPSGQNISRKVLTREQIEENMGSYIEQTSRVLRLNNDNTGRINYRFNSEWNSTADLQKIFQLAKRLNFSQIINRDTFITRLRESSPIYLPEVFYAFVMGYDSVILKPDIEIGGVDQLPNFLICRKLMELANMTPEVAVMTDILPGTDNRIDTNGRPLKMSKSLGNYIPILTNKASLWEKISQLPVEHIWTWFQLLTEITPDELRLLKQNVEEKKINNKVLHTLLSDSICKLIQI